MLAPVEGRMAKFKYEKATKLMDELMGPNRDQDKHVEIIEVRGVCVAGCHCRVRHQNPHLRPQDFRDPRVCKFFLLGMCPYTMFKNTTDDLGTCPSEVCNDKQALKLRKK